MPNRAQTATRVGFMLSLSPEAASAFATLARSAFDGDYVALERGLDGFSRVAWTEVEEAITGLENL